MKKNKRPQKIVATDLDGTLINSEVKISSENLETLEWLGKQNIVRIAATGRSYFSVVRALSKNIPIDYLVFSCGAGIMDWKTKKVLNVHNLHKDDVKKGFDLLKELNLDFSIQKKAPDNHYFYYIKVSDINPDFDRRLVLYPEHSNRIVHDEFKSEDSCQLLAIRKGEDAVEMYEKIKNKLSHLKVIRSTSPIDHVSVWIEVFNKNVSKANGVDFIAKKLNIDKENIMCVGNDYNDLDMLEYTKNSFVVGNSPEELKQKYQLVKSNNEDGFTDAVNQWLKK